MKKFIIFLLVFSSLHLGASFALSITGRTEDGQKVIIHDDGTIEYYDSNKQSLFVQKQNLINKLIKLSGLSKAIEDLPNQLHSQALRGQNTSNSPEVDKLVADTLSSSFDLEQANKLTVKFITDQIDIETINQLLFWYESPLGKKITATEEKFNSPEEQSNLLNFIAQIRSYPPHRERITLIQRFEESAKLTEQIVKMLGSMMKGIMKTFIKISPSSNSPKIEELDALIKEHTSLIESVLREQMILSSLYIYRDISNDDMEKYIRFIASPQGSQYTELTIAAVSKVISDTFNRALPKIIKATQKKDRSNN